MIYSEIFDEVMRIVWGDSAPPSSISSVVLSVGTTAENIANTAFTYRIAGVPYTKTAVAAGTAFTTADTINTGAAAGRFWGVWLVQVNTSGVISTKSPASDQIYSTEAAAIAALPSVDTNNFPVGYVTVQSNTNVDWVAQTDDLIAGSDCNDSNFYSLAGGDYKGSAGVIARIRKNLMEDKNYWFMEVTTTIDLIEHEIEYTLPANFKEEKSILVYDSDSDTYRDIEKVNDKEYDRYLQEAQIINLQEDLVTVATTLSVGATAENIANTAFRYRINGISYSVSANVTGTAFTTADTINTGAAAGTFWGIWVVQVDEDGVISTKSPASDQTYSTEAAAIAALPEPDSDNVDIGYVTVNSNSGASWTAGTDDLTDGSDCVEANFYNIAHEISHDNKWPLYYYISPYSTSQRKISFFPIPKEAMTDGIYIKYYSYLEDLSDTVATWNAYSDYFSIESPEVLIWMCVKDIAQTQRDSTLLQLAIQNLSSYVKLFKKKDWNQKTANGSEIPYEDI